MNSSPNALVKPLRAVAVVTAILLLIPLVAMHFTDEVSWTGRDFATAAALLLTAGTSMVIVFIRVSSPLCRRLLMATILLALLAVWAELAVGIFH